MTKAKETSNVVDTETYQYDTMKARGKDGKMHTARGNQDAIAMAFFAHKLNGGDIESVIKANKLDDVMKPHIKKPPGQLRMTLGVVLRGLVRNGTPVKIGKIVVESEKQRVDLPKYDEPKAPRTKKAAA